MGSINIFKPDSYSNCWLTPATSTIFSQNFFLEMLGVKPRANVPWSNDTNHFAMPPLPPPPPHTKKLCVGIKEKFSVCESEFLFFALKVKFWLTGFNPNVNETLFPDIWVGTLNSTRLLFSQPKVGPYVAHLGWGPRVGDDGDENKFPDSSYERFYEFFSIQFIRLRMCNWQINYEKSC